MSYQQRSLSCAICWKEAELGEDGKVYVKGVQGLMASTARLEYLQAGLRALKLQHEACKASEAVDKTLVNMGRILAQIPPALAPLEPQQSKGPMDDKGEEEDEDLEVTYLTARDPTIPKADLKTLQELRRKARHTIDNVDAHLFPHLFPEGEGGYPQQAQQEVHGVCSPEAAWTRRALREGPLLLHVAARRAHEETPLRERQCPNERPRATTDGQSV